MKKIISFSLCWVVFCASFIGTQAQCIFTEIGYESIPQEDGTYEVISVSGAIDTVTNEADLMICTYIQYSNPDDLHMKVICPNGQSISLLEEGEAGNAAFFGDSGYLNQCEYFWTSNPSYPSIEEVATGTNIVPMGTYRSSESFEGLIGCPINGYWVLEISDETSQGNGSSSVFGIKFLAGFEDCNNWDYDILLGCIDSTACNYNPFVFWDPFNTPCHFGSGCTDVNALNFDPNAGCDNGMCIYLNIGCTDESALNYNPEANQDDGSCEYLSGCTDEDACNYNPEAVIDDSTCEYISCAGVNINLISINHVCDTTVVVIEVGEITPDGVVFYVIDTVSSIFVALSEGTYYLEFTSVNDTLYENLPLYVSPFPYQEFYPVELNPVIWFEIFTSPEQPIVVDNGNGMLECTNCDQDIVDLAWILNWDDSPQEDVIQDTALITVPGNFSGTVKVCLGNADCYSCSEEFQFVEIEEKSYTPNLQIFSNGERPILIPNENGTLFVYDSLGRILYVVKVSIDERVEINIDYGVYEVVFNNRHYKIALK